MAGVKMVEIKIKRLLKVPIPKRKTKDSVGVDLAAAEDKVILAKSFGVVRTGIALQLPRGVEAQIRPRSGLAAKFGIGILNAPGTIDSDYRGEIKVILFNLGEKNYSIKKGDRIAQMVFSAIMPVVLKEVKRLSRTKRGKGGFGSTGR